MARWLPDDQLIEAVRHGCGSRRMSELTDADRCWVVAGLGAAGLTAEDIADRLHCSLRLVRSIRAETMTQVCALYQQEVAAFANSSALAESDLRAVRRELATMTEDRDRLRGQLDRVIDARLAGEPVDACGRGHLMVDWNVYWHGGRRWCRECHAERQRDYRLAKRLGVSPADVRAAREGGAIDAFIESVLAAGSTAQLDAPSLPGV